MLQECCETGTISPVKLRQSWLTITIVGPASTSTTHHILPPQVSPSDFAGAEMLVNYFQLVLAHVDRNRRKVLPCHESVVTLIPYIWQTYHWPGKNGWPCFRLNSPSFLCKCDQHHLAWAEKLVNSF